MKFGRYLERIEELAFLGCECLERITIPLKDGLIAADSIFMRCDSLAHVDFVGGELHQFIAALQLDGWRDDMNREIDSINPILPHAPAGGWDDDGNEDHGQKAIVIRVWIRAILGIIDHYEAQHQHILDEAATMLQVALPRDIVMNNVLPFLALPSHTFEVEDQDMEENDSVHDEGV